MDCGHHDNGTCRVLGRTVDVTFCTRTCQHGRFVRDWHKKIQSPPPDPFAPCRGCPWFHGCGRFCRLLTRRTDLAAFLAAGSRCPDGRFGPAAPAPRAATDAHLHPQPDRHPGRWKKIFTRADGTLVDLIDLYHGKTCFLCCGGPSFAAVDKTQLTRPGILTMAVNNTAHRFRPTLWTAQDPPYRFMWTIWEDPSITKFTLWDYRRQRYWLPRENRAADRTLEQCPNLFFHKRKSDLVADRWLDEDRIVWGTPKELADGSVGGRSVFLAALHILYFLGFHKIYLVGVDFEMSAEKKYWFDEHRGPAAIRNNQRVYAKTAEHCRTLRPHLEKAGVNIFNCNPDSKLTAFDHVPLAAAIAATEIDLSDSTNGMYVKR